MNGTRKNLIGLSRSELSQELKKIGEKNFRAKQLWHWIYSRGLTNFNDMTTLSKAFRRKLLSMYRIERLKFESETLCKIITTETYMFCYVYFLARI